VFRYSTRGPVLEYQWGQTRLILRSALRYRIKATRCVAQDNHPAFRKTVADHACFTVVLPCVLDLQRDTGKDKRGVSDVESAIPALVVVVAHYQGNVDWISDSPARLACYCHIF
jgi:hypothetical protein